MILGSPCLYEGMVKKGIDLCQKHGATYKYIECYLNNIEEINRRLQTRERKISQITKVESEVAFKNVWLAVKGLYMVNILLWILESR